MVRSLSTTLLGAVVLVVGCAGEPAPPPAADAPDPAVVTWMGQLCTATQHFALMPGFLDIPHPRSSDADRKRLFEWLDQVIPIMTKANSAIQAVGPGPTEPTRALYGDLNTSLAKSLTDLSAYSREAVLFPGDQLDTLYTLVIVAASPWEAGGPGLSAYLNKHPDLTAAHDHAPACTRPPPSTPTR